MDMDYLNKLTGDVIGVAIDVHRQLGPLLEEPVYEEALSLGLTAMGIENRRQRGLPLTYKQVRLDCGYRLDLLVKNVLPLELKAVEVLHPIHEAQLLTYQRIGEFPIGLLINFHVELLKHGIRRKIETRKWVPEPATLTDIDPARAFDSTSAAVVMAATEVHRVLGPGLLPNSYLECLCYELSIRGVAFEKEKHLPLRFNGQPLSLSTQIPLLVAGQLPILPLAVEEITEIHRSAVLAWLKQSGLRHGLIVNFHALTMRQNIRRIVN